jgi:hypothetical protein
MIVEANHNSGWILKHSAKRKAGDRLKCNSTILQKLLFELSLLLRIGNAASDQRGEERPRI